jgi:hypothetical protein
VLAIALLASVRAAWRQAIWLLADERRGHGKPDDGSAGRP